jgi:hypothetical protein
MSTDMDTEVHCASPERNGFFVALVRIIADSTAIRRLISFHKASLHILTIIGHQIRILSFVFSSMDLSSEGVLSDTYWLELGMKFLKASYQGLYRGRKPYHMRKFKSGSLDALQLY